MSAERVDTVPVLLAPAFSSTGGAGVSAGLKFVLLEGIAVWAIPAEQLLFCPLRNILVGRGDCALSLNVYISHSSVCP